ncbi:hypothetical protein CXB51_024489 [Gossypium anomalum]|uniref:Uncharacterized protein n=1 Tax=Gossypium anomalum TaxID=47600 RepID=A0A8J5YGC4_9ROSI|nr:hypothetical protein CXB51_024489 [Gossypium anomalum]
MSCNGPSLLSSIMTNAEDDLPPLTNSGVLSTNINSDFSSKQVNVRLDYMNYFLWKHYVFFTIHDHAREDFLDGSAPIPPKVVVSLTSETLSMMPTLKVLSKIVLSRHGSYPPLVPIFSLRLLAQKLL